MRAIVNVLLNSAIVIVIKQQAASVLESVKKEIIRNVYNSILTSLIRNKLLSLK